MDNLRRLFPAWRSLSPWKRFGILGAGAVLTVTIIGWASGVWESGPEPAGERPTTRAKRGPLSIEVVESGTVQPRKQIILKNETGDPAALIFVAPEGSRVQEGDPLFELDATQLENDITERRIRVRNDEADLVSAEQTLKVVKNQEEANVEQARLDLRFAKQDLKKYQEGEYPKLLDEANAKITLAQETLSQAEEDLKWSRVLYEEKYLSESELKQDDLAKQKAELDLRLAQAELGLLENYTYQRQIDQLESDLRQAEKALERSLAMSGANIAQAEAQLENRKAELVEERSRLQRDESRLSKTKIHAPISGIVLYATSVGDRWRRNDEPIENGTVVDEKQEIIYLPTNEDYNIEIKIPEVDLGKVREGMTANIKLDALPNENFTGRVASIATLPDQDSRYLNPNLKLYETVIELDRTEAAVRNGMSARAEIAIQQYDDVVYVPIQTVVRVGGRPTVFLVQADQTIEPREVGLGLDNGRFVHIIEGLEGGEKILLAPPLRTGSEQEEPPPAQEGKDGSGEQERQAPPAAEEPEGSYLPSSDT